MGVININKFKLILIISLLCNILLISLFFYNNAKNENEIKTKISEKADNISKEISSYVSGYELSYLFMISDMKSLNDIDEYRNFVDSSGIYDAMIVSKDKIKSNSKDLINIFNLIKADYKNPKIKDKISDIEVKLFY
jgi:Na+/melibiose symporter-like transporter